MTVVDWLFDSDLSIRRQVMRDLTDAPAEAVAAQRARVAHEGWGSRLTRLEAHVAEQQKFADTGRVSGPGPPARRGWTHGLEGGDRG